MTPQEVATRLTESYFSKVHISWLLEHEFKGKTSVEVYTEVFNTFFKQASNNINENSSKVSRLN